MLHLQETKSSNTDDRLLRNLWGAGSRQGAFLYAIGSAGGLISIWKDNFFVHNSVQEERSCLFLFGFLKRLSVRYVFINIYATNEEVDKSILFQQLGQKICNIEVPICLCGDFNVVRSQEEKNGVVFNFDAMKVFVDFIEDNNLVDLPLSGGRFTWCSKRVNPSFSRLDRFLVSPNFLELFQLFFQKILPRSLSDHNPITLSIDDKNWGAKPFHLFNFWLLKKGFRDSFEEAWCEVKRGNDNVGDLWHKLRSVKPRIKQWHANNFNQNGAKIQKLEEDINSLKQRLQRDDSNVEIQRELSNLRGDLWKRYRAKELSWMQKARVCWPQ